MVVEFLIEVKAMKDNLLPSIFMQEYNSFSKEIKEGKVTVSRNDIDSRIEVTIKDKKLEMDFLKQMHSFREKMGLKLMKSIGIFPKILQDGKEVKF